METHANLTSSQSEWPRSAEVWTLLRENGMKQVLRDVDQFKFLAKESDVLKPRIFFGRLVRPVIKGLRKTVESFMDSDHIEHIYSLVLIQGEPKQCSVPEIPSWIMSCGKRSRKLVCSS